MKYFLSLFFIFLVNPSHAQEEEYYEPAPRSPRVGEIYPADQERVRTRVETLNLTSLAFGPSWGGDVNNSSMFYYFHAGYSWEPHVNAEIRLNLDGAIAGEDEGLWISTSIGGAWLISTANFSPLIGAEAGFGYAHIDDAEDPAGFLLGGFAGIRFFRTATAQLSLEGFVQTILDEEKPVLGGVRLSVLF